MNLGLLWRSIRLILVRVDKLMLDLSSKIGNQSIYVKGGPVLMVN